MEKSLSIVIPNYNGIKLLEKNLPQVIKYSPGAQIIVVDDASDDDSVALIRDKFKDVKVIELKKNLGFAGAVNEGVKNATGDLVVLLNSDVSPQSGYIKAAKSHFKNQKVFAVGFADLDHQGGNIRIAGRGGARFEKGLLVHRALEPKTGETLWVSGGSAMFDRLKFQSLGGFDRIFAPFYWEDIDLSYRAWKLGKLVLFEQKSIVDHCHDEGAIKSHHSPFFVKTVSYKNQLIFVWKNIDSYNLVMKHYLWLPYNLIKSLLTLDLAFLLGFLWASSQVPALILNSSFPTGYSLKDEEVIGKFEKQ